jgi:hypothetical protein
MTNQVPVNYTDEDVSRRIKVSDHVVVIQPERNFTVPVEVQIHDMEPSFVARDWDHIAEVSLHVPTGKLEVEECTGGTVAKFSVVAGWYRVRSFHAGLSSVNGLEGNDHYLIVLWPAPEAPLAVIKQY